MDALDGRNGGKKAHTQVAVIFLKSDNSPVASTMVHAPEA